MSAARFNFKKDKNNFSLEKVLKRIWPKKENKIDHLQILLNVMYFVGNILEPDNNNSSTCNSSDIVFPVEKERRRQEIPGNSPVAAL